MNRAQRRRLKSKKPGATQLHHSTMGAKLKAEQDETVNNNSLFNQADNE